MRACTSKDFADVLFTTGLDKRCMPIYIQFSGMNSASTFVFCGTIALRDLNTNPKLVLIVNEVC